MLTPRSLKPYVGRMVNVFGAWSDKEGELIHITSGHLVAAEPGCLVMADREGEEADTRVALQIVGLVALQLPPPKKKATRGRQ